MNGPGRGFTFDPVTHTYRVDGERMLSITQVLKLSGAIDMTWYTEDGRRLGSCIHQLTESLDNGKIDAENLPPEPAAYIEAYKKFKCDTGIVISHVEYPSFNSVYRIAGTIDRIGLLYGRPVVLDLKIGQKAKWHALQTAGYVLLLSGDYDRYNIYLSRAGNYQLIQHNDPMDFNVFIAALTLANWKHR